MADINNTTQLSFSGEEISSLLRGLATLDSRIAEKVTEKMLEALTSQELTIKGWINSAIDEYKNSLVPPTPDLGEDSPSEPELPIENTKTI